MLLNLATTLQDVVPLFDAPAPGIELHDAGGLFGRSDFFGGQQQPFDALGARRWIFFLRIHGPQRDGFPRTQIAAGRVERDFLETYRQQALATWHGLLLGLAVLGLLPALPRDQHLELSLRRAPPQPPPHPAISF